MAVIYLVRHGQASFAAREYDRLSALGVRQARALGESLRHRLPTPDRVVTGGMSRHRDTARECLAALGLDGPPGTRPEVDERWSEYDHRDVIERHKPAYRSQVLMGLDLARAGDPARAFQAMFDQALLRWVEADTGYHETWPAFSQRVGAALDDLAAGLERSQTALVFTSGGPISAASARLLGAGRDVWLNLTRVTVNTGVTTLVHGARGTSLVSFNDHCHVDGELLTYR